jgi:thiol-disulfide isomerase/thioredoxin
VTSPRRSALAAAIAAGLLSSACTGGTTATDAGAVPSTSPTASSPAPSTPGAAQSQSESEPAVNSGGGADAVPASLDFTATTVSGADFAGADVAGKPVVLWFWAPWCPTCRGQGPDVAALAEQYGDRVTVVGVGSLDSGDAIAGFADDFPDMVHLSDPDGDLWKRFGIVEQSSFIVLDADGEEALRTGYAGDDELADAVAAVV